MECRYTIYLIHLISKLNEVPHHKGEKKQENNTIKNEKQEIVNISPYLDSINLKKL